VAQDQCISCHDDIYQRWLGSHHDLAMQEANEKTVLGDFNDATFSHFDVTSRFYKSAGKFFVNTEGPDGSRHDYEIIYTFGFEPLQQYLIEFPQGRLQCLTIAWDTVRKEWFHLYPDERITHDDPLHWTGLYQNWNYMCADCHSTNLQKNYDEKTDTYSTTWDIIDVSCQACHGPGSEHVAWAEGNRDGNSSGYENTGLLMDLKGDPKAQVDACAPCHSRRSRISAEHWYGKAFLDVFRPSLLRQDLYFPDGQILEEVYVYGSFIQSKMHRAGVRCSDCHDPHSLELVKAGNAICVQCHQLQPPTDFQTLQLKRYDDPEHHFHPPGSDGAQCVNCHMSSRNYMVVDPRRDHSFRIPRPDLSVEYGTPNACNSCHDDKSFRWAADVVVQWYGADRLSDFDFVGAFAAAQKNEHNAENALLEVIKNPAQAAIVRATAVELLNQYVGDHVTDALINAAASEDAILRTAAVGALDRLPPERRMAVISPFLHDSVRVVRLEAVRVLADAFPESASPLQRQIFEVAVAEFQESQLYAADQPGAHLNLAVLHQNLESSESGCYLFARMVESRHAVQQ
jgi:hypothetical protein